MAITPPLQLQSFGQGQFLIAAQERNGTHLPQIQAESVIGCVGVFLFLLNRGRRLFRLCLLCLFIFFRSEGILR